MSINVTEEPMLLYIRNAVKNVVRLFILRKSTPVTLPVMTQKRWPLVVYVIKAKKKKKRRRKEFSSYFNMNNEHELTKT